MTNAALVAKIIRAELKKHGIAGRVKSSNYTGGSSVDVYVSDQLPATVQKIKEFCSDYKAGYFDGQTDMYVYQHNDNPTVSFIFVHNEISPDLMKRAEDFVRSFYANPGVGYDFDTKVWDNLHAPDSAFWRQNKPRIAA